MGMTLKDLLEKLQYEVFLKGSFPSEEEALRLFVPAVVSDERKLSEGCLFICCRLTLHNGAGSIAKAMDAGASAIVTEPGLYKEYSETASAIKQDAVVIFTEDTRLAMALIYAAWYGHPAEKMTVIGITGTKGKTTTAHMLYAILTKAGKKTGLVGTVETIIGEKHIPSLNTTPEADLLQKMLCDMAEVGTEIVVMEVSSQALMTHRSSGFVFDIGIFTNLSEDHIGGDACRDFAHYLHCKSLLMRQCKTGIVNIDDPYAEAILKDHTCSVKTFGLSEGADLIGSDIVCRFLDGVPGVEFEAAGMQFRLKMPGTYSVSNALAAIQTALELQIPKETIAEALEEVQVNGRAEVIRPAFREDENDPAVIVDFAHNGMSMRTILSTLKMYYTGNIICVTGASGFSCRWRAIGQACGKFADLTVVTCDDIGEEDSEEIMNEIARGIREMNGDFILIEDRREAVRCAISEAGPEDLVVLAGRGHEIGLKQNGRIVPMPTDRALAQEVWNDRKEKALVL